MKVGVVLESFGLSFRQALPQAATFGLGGIQFDATGELSPERLGVTARRDIRNLLKSSDLEAVALHCPMRRGIDAAENQQPRIEYVRNVMSLAFELGARNVVVAMPRVPQENEARALPLREAITAFAAHADRIGCFLALEAGYDDPTNLMTYLDSYPFGSIRVTFDPMNFLLHGYDPIRAAMPLVSRIALVHARDGCTAGVSGGAQETALGAGDIDWLTLGATLSAMEYRGPVLVERTAGENRLNDVQAGALFLRRTLAPAILRR